MSSFKTDTIIKSHLNKNDNYCELNQGNIILESDFHPWQ